MDFHKWLVREIEKSGLSYSELARRGGISRARISQVVSGERPGADFCVGIAKALGVPPDYVLRLAGILPSLPERGEDHWLWRAWAALEELTPAQREEVIAYAYWKRSQEVG